MIDTTTDKGKLIAAAMQLAAERPWGEISMRDIAEAAGLPFSSLRGTFGSKTQIIAGYIRAVDDAVLANVPEREAGERPNDALFEILMARFDAMAPHKEALRSIAKDFGFDTALLGSVMNSQRWMLIAAGIDGDGPRGVLRTSGLASLFASVFQIWLEDDDPGLARTMAALDRRLRRAAGTMQTLDQACEGIGRLRDAVFGGFRRASDRARDTVREMGPETPVAEPPGPEANGAPQGSGV